MQQRARFIAKGGLGCERKLALCCGGFLTVALCRQHISWHYSSAAGESRQIIRQQPFEESKHVRKKWPSRLYRIGVMGYPMAGHLAKQASAVTVFNRTSAKASQWLEDYRDSPAACASATSPRAAATDADVVFVCVGNDDDVAEVVLGREGALAGMSPGSLLIDHTTASQVLAQKLGTACTAQSVGFLDAPVSGGQAGAENGA